MAKYLLAIGGLALAGACTTQDEVFGDPSPPEDGKGDSGWWQPERDLAISNQPFRLDAASPGQAFRGSFSSKQYAAVMFDAAEGAPLRVFTRSWLDKNEGNTWETYPYVFAWKGDSVQSADSDFNDWNNWSMIRHHGNDFVMPLPRDGRYLVVAMTTQASYKAAADYLIYVAHGDADLGSLTAASVSGTVRCGDDRRPARGVTLSIGESTEKITSNADGTFAFAGAYPVGRANIWAKAASVEIGYFDAVLTPTSGQQQLILPTCP